MEKNILILDDDDFIIIVGTTRETIFKAKDKLQKEINNLDGEYEYFNYYDDLLCNIHGTDPKAKYIDINETIRF